ncbi:Kef-type K+ transport system membrane component KefB [Allocatelliglobosispora scoriae]|uniref:Kef-type K+ transport system membrane component KefB n=1 Tax=Allocatelliglobosispora scoriae TaxID=643052 RepID=A0A841BZN4_9ACTN|nr:cation:proton antiporter [Allocatelliglobosispora scoriae]MBB5872559.1 Kef-type K+ transport system membrane component KefB [Allocatelliglobosispora scoriae]
MSSLIWRYVALIMAAALMGPLIADRLRRWVAIPTVVVEIALGIILGPAILGWVHDGDVVGALADLGVMMLFFLAGYEVDFRRIAGKPIKLATVGWICSFAVGLLVAGIATRDLGATMVVAVAVSTTALGTILPIVRDAGLLPQPLGARIMAVGAIGEFAPMIAIALFLSGARPGRTIIALVLFVLLTVGAALLAMREPSERLRRLLTATLGTSAQFAVRLCLLAAVAFVWIAVALNLDMIMGAFAAGITMKLVLATISEHEAEQVESKLDGIGFGLLIPIFFVMTGVRFDLRALLASPKALLLLPLVLLLFLLARGLVTYVVHRNDQPEPQRRQLALFAAAQLPLVVVATDLGVERGFIGPDIAASMVGAAMLSVAIYPLLALRVPSRPAPALP